jgi:hypothetical protein
VASIFQRFLLSSKQHKLIHVNEELKLSIDRLSQKVKDISKILGEKNEER